MSTTAPILDDEGNVFVMRKAGQYVSCDPPGSGSPPPCGPAVDEQVWTERAYAWRRGRLVPRWTFISDWKPYPDAWEAAFQPAMSGRFIYLPGAGGTVFKVDKRTGRSVRRINPFGSTIDPFTWVAGGLAIDGRASLYFNVIRRVVTPAGVDARSWLVRVSRRGAIRRVSYRRLIPGAPGATDLCHTAFRPGAPVPPHPWPPPPGPDGSATLPPLVACLAQRAAVNVTPAIGRDGSIFTVTRAHNPSADYDAYVVAVRRDLTLKWATSLGGHLNDGCGVLVPYGPLWGCRLGAEVGVDPTTNQPPAGQANESGTSSPVVLPGGGVLYGRTRSTTRAAAI